MFFLLILTLKLSLAVIEALIISNGFDQRLVLLHPPSIPKRRTPTTCYYKISKNHVLFANFDVKVESSSSPYVTLIPEMRNVKYAM